MRESGANPEWPTFSSFLSKFFRSRNFNKSYNFRTLFSHLFSDFYLPVREGNGGAECKKGGKSIYVTGLCKKKSPENEGISFSRKKRKRKKRWCEHVANGLFCVWAFFSFLRRGKGKFSPCAKSGQHWLLCLQTHRYGKAQVPVKHKYIPKKVPTEKVEIQL